MRANSAEVSRTTRPMSLCEVWSGKVALFFQLINERRQGSLRQDCQTNYSRAGFKVAKWRMFCHSDDVTN